MKKIKLTKGEYAVIDDKDYFEISKYNWHFSNTGYAARNLSSAGKLKHKLIHMHRELMNPNKKEEVDHINNNKLDNRRDNLRVCSSSENKFNTNKPKTNKSGYKGVYWESDRKKWTVQFRAYGKRIRIGSFNRIEDAVIAYNTNIKKFQGNFARLNII